MGRRKYLTFKTLIFGNFWGPEVVGSNSYQKNIGVKFTHCVRRSLWTVTTLATLAFRPHLVLSYLIFQLEEFANYIFCCLQHFSNLQAVLWHPCVWLFLFICQWNHCCKLEIMLWNHSHQLFCQGPNAHVNYLLFQDCFFLPTSNFITQWFSC